GTEAGAVGKGGIVIGSQVVRCLGVIGLFIGVSSAWAEPLYNFTTIDVPGAVSTSASGINDAGQIVGSFSDATRTHGLLKTGWTFTTMEVPDATVTQGNDINDAGQIVGFFTDSGGHDHGFLKDDSTLTTIDVPGVVSIMASGINDAGQIVGSTVTGLGF